MKERHCEHLGGRILSGQKFSPEPGQLFGAIQGRARVRGDETEDRIREVRDRGLKKNANRLFATCALSMASAGLSPAVRSWVVTGVVPQIQQARPSWLRQNSLALVT